MELYCCCRSHSDFMPVKENLLYPLHIRHGLSHHSNTGRIQNVTGMMFKCEIEFEIHFSLRLAIFFFLFLFFYPALSPFPFPPLPPSFSPLHPDAHTPPGTQGAQVGDYGYTLNLNSHMAGSEYWWGDLLRWHIIVLCPDIAETCTVSPAEADVSPRPVGVTDEGKTHRETYALWTTKA